MPRQRNEHKEIQNDGVEGTQQADCHRWTYRGRIIMSLPGSTGAVRLAMDKLILPELGHLVAMIQPL